MGLAISRRGFLKALSAGVALTILPAPSVIVHAPGPQQGLTLVGGYMETEDYFWLRVSLTLPETESTFHDLVRITNRPVEQLYRAFTESVNLVCKGRLIRPIEESEVIEAFTSSQWV